MHRVSILIMAALFFLQFSASAEPDAIESIKSRLQKSMEQHLNLLLEENGKVPVLKGKSADGQGALAFYRMFEITGDARYRNAALTLSHRILKDMRAMNFGVLPIKEKEKEDGRKFIGGGPPAMGFYTGNIAYILSKEGGHSDDLKYLGNVLDEYPWNEKGWWSQDIDVKTGEPKVSMDKPSIINKCAVMAMATGMLSKALEDIDSDLAERLKRKTDTCIYNQIIPTQLDDGFWHYNLNGNDPESKDILGYFMLTTHALMELQDFNNAYNEPKLNAAIRKAQMFSLNCIAPMADPNTGPPCTEHTTSNTPSHYNLAEETKRGFQLGYILVSAGFFEEGIKVMDASLEHFPYGDAGMDGIHAAAPSAAILERLDQL